MRLNLILTLNTKCSVSFVTFFTLLVSSVLALPSEIYLGGLFETGDEALELAFRYAIERVNADSKILPYTRLVPKIERLEKSDSFQASRKVCSLAAHGVAAIFGPQSTESSNHVQSTCDVLQIPHMQIRWDYRLEATNQSVNLFPHPLMLGRGLRDLVKTKNWKNFAILYEDNDALIRIQEVLKDLELREKRIVVRQFIGEDYRKVFKEVGKMQIKNLILDVHRDRIHTALRHAQQVEELSEYHNYLFTSLDLQTVDMEDYQYAGTNISSFCLMDESSPSFLTVINDWQLNSLKGFNSLTNGAPNQFNTGISNQNRWNVTSISNGFTSTRIWPLNFTTEVALMFDSVLLFATALNDLQRTQEITIRPLSCEKEDVWQFGSTLTNYMRMISSVKGLTGEIKFDDSGLRTDMKLRLLEITRDGMKPVGHWTTQESVVFMSNYTKRMQEEFRATLKNKTLTIVTTFSRPYTMRVDDYETKTGNDIYEGFSIDLIKAISEILNFKYNIKIVDDGTYGAKKENGEWGGMVRELIDGKADIAVADLTITYERESAVDFTMPFMNLGIGILYRKPKKEPPKLFSFMSPLAIEVWIYLLTAFLGVTLCLFVIARFSPYEWINPHPCVKDPDELENNFTMKNTLWFTIGCLMQQGCDIMPRALSTRVLAASWWFFILILVSSYTANLAAFLTVERMVNPIESVEDLAKQQKIPYGCQDSGSTQAFFKESNFSTYSRMWSFMESARPSVFVESNDKGVERVKKGDYAFLMESTSIEYIVERECELYQVGGLLDSKGYGIATPPESPYRGIISDAILELQELGILQELKNMWWSVKKGGGQCGPKDGAQKAAGAASELGLANVGGVFVVLAGGSVIAIIICVSEFVWKMKQIPRNERDNIFIELMRELKHVICCYGSTRPVRKCNMDDLASQSNSIPPFLPLAGYGFTPSQLNNDLSPQMNNQFQSDGFS